MSDQTPELQKQQRLAWYRGLSRYQWWILIVASMGWMFDTMNQQFFNLGRGPAMLELTGASPVVHGLEALEEGAPAVYGSTDLDELVAKDMITSEQKAELMLDRNQQPRDKVNRKDVAKVVGHNILSKTKYLELAEESDFKEFQQASFNSAAMQQLVEEKLISQKNADKYLSEFPSGEIPRSELAARLGKELARVNADAAGDDATFIFVMGWAVGGLLFGYVGDALGRAKTMAITIATYAVFTGLNGFAQTEMQFHVLRFLAALGVGGEFAAGAALVAESMPDRSRPAALGALQALSALGNMMAAAIAFFVLKISWRWLFGVGAIPVVVAVFVFLTLKEPEKWIQARRQWLEDRRAGKTKKRSSYAGVFQDPRWRKRAIVGLVLGVVGVGGLWGVAFFTPELNRSIARNYSEAKREEFVSIAFFLQQFGAFLGISAYTWIAEKKGRRPAFGIFFALAFLIVSYTFLRADTIAEAYLLAPLVGFVTLGPFGGYSIYFPELFPTRLRSTGVGFCYNVGRFLAALVPSFKARLKELFLAGTLTLPFLVSAQGDASLAIRYGSFLMIFIYIIGLIALLFAPETKGQPLPEE